MSTIASCIDPAHASCLRMRNDNYSLTREVASWNAKVRKSWDGVRFLETGPAPGGPVISGKAIPISAAVDLAGLSPDDVRVEMVLGRVAADGGLEDTEVLVLPPSEHQGTTAIFSKEIIPDRTGRLGYALRISPNHFEDPLTRPCSSLLKWSTGRAR